MGLETAIFEVGTPVKFRDCILHGCDTVTMTNIWHTDRQTDLE